ncbi:MAG: hypothetical protein ABEH78_05665 [Haloferacaceae archaeon]
MSARSPRPAAWPTAGAFLLGALLGTALVAPALPPLLAARPSIGSFDPTGTMLIAGILAIVAFVLGLVAVYFGLFLGED